MHWRLLVKKGDLVKRAQNVWSEWSKHNPWMTQLGSEVGVIIRLEYKYKTMAVVLWPHSGLCPESIEDLEVL